MLATRASRDPSLSAENVSPRWMLQSPPRSLRGEETIPGVRFAYLSLRAFGSAVSKARGFSAVGSRATLEFGEAA